MDFLAENLEFVKTIMTRFNSNLIIFLFTLMALVLFFELILQVTKIDNFQSPFANTKDFETKYVIRNSHGFRDKDYSYQKPNNIFRILVLGDSQTFGLGIKKLKNTWHKKLEELMNQGLERKRFEIITMAENGWNTDNQLYELFKSGFEYQPDLILLGFYQNDVLVLHDFKCQSNDIRFFSYSKIIAGVRKTSKVYQFLEFRINRLLEKLKQKPTYAECISRRFNSRGWDMAKIYLDTILMSTQIKNIHFMLTIIPLIYKLGEDYPLKSAHKKIRNYCYEKEIICEDLYEKGFKGLNADKLVIFKNNRHLNEMGSKIVAQTLYKKLKVLKTYKNLSKFNKVFDLKELLDQKQLIRKLDKKLDKVVEKNQVIEINEKAEKLILKSNKNFSHFVITNSKNLKPTIYKITLDRKGRFKESNINFYKGNDPDVYYVHNKYSNGKNITSWGKLINQNKITTSKKNFLLKYTTEGIFKKLEIEQGKYFSDPKSFEKLIFNSPEPDSFIEKVKLEKNIFHGLNYFHFHKNYFKLLQNEILNSKPSESAIRALGKSFLVRKKINKFLKIKENNPSVTFYDYKVEEPTD